MMKTKNPVIDELMKSERKIGIAIGIFISFFIFCIFTISLIYFNVDTCFFIELVK